LRINNIGKIARDPNLGTIDQTAPENISLTVTDSLRNGGTLNTGSGTLEILNAYVRNYATLRADNILAKANGSTARGFTNMNRSNQLLGFDIQGYNYQQPSIISPMVVFQIRTTTLSF
jgi:hypothetical protein